MRLIFYKSPFLLFSIFSVLGIFATLILAVTAFKRSFLEYNAEGRFFDEITGVVYKEQSASAYTTFAIVCFALTLLLIMITVRIYKMKHKK